MVYNNTTSNDILKTASNFSYKRCESPILHGAILMNELKINLTHFCDKLDICKLILYNNTPSNAFVKAASNFSYKSL